ncbi:MAG: heme A synthase [Gammaproteobacteria bacterium]|nr:heme A synthase [Gammaproteobacteria bacterium]
MISLSEEMTDKNRLLVLTWMVGCGALVFCMVILGGTVRLTGSGLSMVEWNLLMGVIPPLGQSGWLKVFGQYQQFPEYLLINSSMTLSEFKFIYLMEYAHRILGRLIGIAFILPFVFFVATKRITTSLLPRLCCLMLLGALQGGIGWYMVKSGLVDDPHVSQYRLTLHFMIAALIYGYMFRVITGLLPDLTMPDSPILKYSGMGVLIIILLMMTTGGFVAGTKAGFIFNTFPLMGNKWIPSQMFDLLPYWKNLTENPVTIQFVHRWLAILVLLIVCLYGIALIRLKALRFVTYLGAVIILAGCFQVLLGISTLVARVPVHLGVIHQGGAFILLTLITISVSAFFPKLYTKPLI